MQMLAYLIVHIEFWFFLLIKPLSDSHRINQNKCKPSVIMAPTWYHNRQQPSTYTQAVGGGQLGMLPTDHMVYLFFKIKTHIFISIGVQGLILGS